MSLDLKPASVIKARLGIQNGGPIHKFFTNECMRHCDRYLPYREGNLSDTANITLRVDSFTYNQLYASYVYYGQRRDGTHKIKHYTLDKHPEAGPYWDKRMWATKKDEIIKAVQDKVDGK